MRYLITLLLFSLKITAQITYDTFNMSKSIEETSGLESYGEHLITHNDSGDKPKLYIINQQGEKIMEIELNQLKNKDWEDIAGDSENFFIADTGNKFGTRENLKIYILDHDFFLEGKISIRYKFQTTFSREPKSEFDAEALAVVDDQLVLFSKNRKTLKSEIYSFPKIAGDYVLTPKTIIDCNALITAADYYHEKDFIALTGYNTKGNQFFFLIRDFIKNGFDKINLQRYLIPIESAQIEAVKIINENEFWISSESEEIGKPRLFRLKLKL
tara:strand:- start:96 stop:908 length:813 start_codon:yes stop_codon:yes gene_type:complete